MSAAFTAKKAKIVQQLSTSDEDYTDASPIGKVDENIRNLVDEINTLDSLVTTSSCSGRIAVYLEGRKKGQAQPEAISDNVSNPSAGAGGKGGGQWLFVSHDPLEEDHDLLSSCAFAGQSHSTTLASPQDVRWIRCKFEPMILHVLCSSIESAQSVQSAALQSGFRESGILSISPAQTESTAMVAVRTAGLAFDSVIGYETVEETRVPMVSEAYMSVLVKLANERFVVNKERTERFRIAILAQFKSGSAEADVDSTWEPAEVRKARLRAEGLLRQAQSRQEAEKSPQLMGAQDNGDWIGTVFGEL